MLIIKFFRTNLTICKRVDLLLNLTKFNTYYLTSVLCFNSTRLNLILNRLQYIQIRYFFPLILLNRSILLNIFIRPSYLIQYQTETLLSLSMQNFLIVFVTLIFLNINSDTLRRWRLINKRLLIIRSGRRICYFN